MQSTTINGVDSTTGRRSAIKVTSGASHVEPTQLANESGEGTSAQIGVSIPKANGTVVDVSTNSTSVSSGAGAFLLGIYVNTAIATEAVGIHDGTGGDELMTLPIGLAAGSYIPCNGRKYDNGIFVESASATGSITVDWWAQP